MKTFTRTLAKHIPATIFLLVFTSICIWIVIIGIESRERFDKYPDKDHFMAGNQGGLFAAIFIGFAGGIYMVINFFLAAFIKGESKFYLWLCLIILIEIIGTVWLAN
ncbi:hypothetical protein [uncultured Mucilaginibacter sp.]|uniref:hypothetical protein n=1 Tax=uncultured Mucilaginibacter sp. TaxID=797541 RepID=UPI0025FBB44C|nr:hypothetical protein [uncultured Mucilaginibacter sp.]